MTQFLTILFSSVTAGAIYGLIALGWCVTYNVSHVLNVAQGEFYMLGAMISVTLVTAFGTPPWLAATAAMVTVPAVAVLLDRVAVRPLRSRSIMTPILATMGVALISQDLAKHFWGTSPLSMPPILSGPPLRVAGALLLRQNLLLFVVTVALAGGLWYLLMRTSTGRAVRAVQENPSLAGLTGIAPGRVRSIAFAISGAIGAVGGILITPLVPIMYDAGLVMGIKGLIAMILGGLGNYSGAVAGGVAIGVIEGFTAGYLSSKFKDIVVFLVIIGILLGRPQGLFQARRAVRD